MQTRRTGKKLQIRVEAANRRVETIRMRAGEGRYPEEPGNRAEREKQ